MNFKHLSLLVIAILLSANAFAGKNKFTVNKYETPNGSQAKVLENSNSNQIKLVIACNNKVIGDDFSNGKMMLVGQDHDVVVSTKIVNSRIHALTENGWEEKFVGSSIPKC